MVAIHGEIDVEKFLSIKDAQKYKMIKWEEDMDKNKVIDVLLDDDQVIQMQVVALGGTHDVGFGMPDFNDILNTIEMIANKIDKAIEKITPSEIEVSFGIAAATKCGKLTSIIVDGETKANLDVKLTWKK